MNNQHSNEAIASNSSNSRWVSCIAKADFWGDSRASQLSFRRNACLYVDLGMNPQNGWRWGEIGARKGWFPDWAVEPIASRDDRSQLSPNSGRSRNRRGSIGRSRDRIAPMLERISDHKLKKQEKIDFDDDYDGFALENNEIMGGKPQKLQTLESSHSEARRYRRNSTGCVDGDISWKKALNIMVEKEERNPYTKHQKQPYWDGSEVPQIVSGVDGSVTVLGSNGEASSYRNRRSYSVAQHPARIAEQGLRIPKPNRNSNRSRSTGTVEETSKQRKPWFLALSKMNFTIGRRASNSSTPNVVY